MCDDTRDDTRDDAPIQSHAGSKLSMDMGMNDGKVEMGKAFVPWVRFSLR
jgi:hypothetical protein